MTQSILVAGGAGYIGSHVCKALSASGYLPVTLDNLTSGSRNFVRFGPLVEASVTDSAIVGQTIRQYNIKAVIDFAGCIEVAESVSDPLKYYTNNAAAKLSFLQILHQAGVQAFVFSSTAAVYGEPAIIPIPESHALLPKNPYGWSKLFFEQILNDFHAAGGPAFIALRYFNAAGASLDGDIGESHHPETHLIPRACLAALGKIPALDIFGNDYPTPDGTAIRDYVHVLDLAAAHVLAVEKLLGGACPATYNLGNGIGTSIGEILSAFGEAGIEIPYQFKPRRAGDPSRLIANTAYARSDLGWQPQHSSIATIIRSAYAWHLKSAN